ncbi:hypothetical protein C8Q74DRAFT_1305018 [Fomes fomentarius]|nr:hypothetical protein C8Q74DRAFT_1305018 [Fomes fomentarius]
MSFAANHGYQFVRPKVEIRQHLLEDGSFLDIPAEILPIPAPKPAQFLHLRHHYMTPSGIKEDLHECESVEAQIDVLANEVAGMKHLVRGFVTNLSTLAKHFDAGHEEIQESLKGLLDSYEGVNKFVNPLLKDTLDISCVPFFSVSLRTA